MASEDHRIEHVSDTALMVAACRARETELDDAFARDPFATRLAGERGMAILAALPHATVFQLGLAIRTRFFDELLLEALAKYPIATVLSVGCGLDTRPWRLDLPKSLRWVEVDFVDMLEYKEALMASETARCHRERLATDLNDASQRRAIYEAAGLQPALMITEGLLMYLPGATVDALAKESREQSSIAHWITEITTTEFGKAIGAPDAMASIRRVQASDCLPGEEILATLNRNGYTDDARRSYLTDVGFVADRVRRMAGGTMPPRPQFPPGDLSGVHRLAKTPARASLERGTQ